MIYRICIIHNTLSGFVAPTPMFGIALVSKGLASSGYGLTRLMLNLRVIIQIKVLDKLLFREFLIG